MLKKLRHFWRVRVLRYPDVFKMMDAVDQKIVARLDILNGGGALYDDARRPLVLVGVSDSGLWLSHVPEDRPHHLASRNRVVHMTDPELLNLHILESAGAGGATCSCQ